MSWEVIIAPAPRKRIAKIPQPEQGRILSAITKLENGPSGDIKPMKSSNNWRLRAGDWRIIVSVDWIKKVFHVVRIDTRGDIYKH